MVFIPSYTEQFYYFYGGISVTGGNYKLMVESVSAFKPDRILIHFINNIAFKFLLQNNIPIIMWVHGYGAIGWWRYLFDFKFNKAFLMFVLVNTKNLFKFRALSKLKNLRYVFVSNYMRRVAIADTGNIIREDRHAIIPNPIDEKLFNYKQKSPEDRRHILLIRPFNSLKYAPDIAIDTILELSKSKIFNKLNFTIYGEGEYFYLTDKLKGMKNISINNRFIPPEEIAILHKRNGIFLCPSRMDAQGVSMCEAMMSGLVPITSRTTGIPEFVSNCVDGFLCKSAKEMALKIEQLYNNPAMFLSMSAQAHKNILDKCGSSKIIKKELCYIEHGK
jgi:glycosyltransferase involved in cell wall biosynthesis